MALTPPAGFFFSPSAECCLGRAPLRPLGGDLRATASRTQRAHRLGVPTEQRNAGGRAHSGCVLFAQSLPDGTGSDLPLAAIGSASRYSNRARVARYVCSPTRIPSTGAADSIRAAVFMTSPAADHSPSLARASSITSASPVLMPIRKWRSSHSSSVFSSASTLRMASPARTAPFGLVLVCPRRAKQSEDRVAAELLEGAAVPFELGP